MSNNLRALAPSREAAPRSASKSTPKSAPPWESPEWQEAVRQNPGLKPFFDNLESFVELPGGIKKLRQLVMELGVAGKLLDQDESEEPAQELIERINTRRTELVESKVIRAKTPMRDKKLPETKLPSGWIWSKFGDITFNRDGERIPVRKADRETQPKNYDYYGASGVIDKVEDFIFDQPLLLIGEDGANLINRSTPIAFIAEGKYWVNNHAHVVDLISRDMMDYVALFINSISLEPYITGMAQPKMNQARMNSIPVAVPPEAEQRRIVSKVEGLMSLCDTLESHRRARESVRERASRSVLVRLTSAPRTASTGERPPAAPKRQASGVETLASAWQRLSDHFEVLLDQPSGPAHLRQSILQLAVQGKLVPQDPIDEPASKTLESLLAQRAELLEAGAIRKRKALTEEQRGDPMFDAPEGWCWDYFENLADLTSGVTKGRKLGGRKTEAYPYLRVANVQRWFVDTTVMKEIEIPVDELEKYRLEKGDLVMIEGGDWDKLGRTAIWNGEIENCLHQNHVFRARLFHDGIDREWIMMFMNSIVGREYFAGASKQTTNLASINMTQLRSCPVPVPPKAEQKRIVSKVSVLLSQLDELSARLRSRQSTTDALLTALIHQILNQTDSREAAKLAKEKS